MLSQILEVTPQQAQEWLKANTFNRSVSRRVVQKYAKDMADGNWTLNHQGIAFDDDGVLVDGQHRLMAIIESQKPIKMMVSFGSARVGIDELRPRSPQDVIKFGSLSGWITSKNIQTANAAKAIFINSDAVTSAHQIVELCDKYKEGILFADQSFATHRKGISCAPVRAVFMVASYHFEHEKLKRMISILYSGVAAGIHESAAIKARDLILEGGFGGGGSERIYAARKLTRAVRAFALSEPLSRLLPQSDVCFSIPDPI